MKKSLININIDKKSALIIAAVVSFFAMADYVSVVNSGAAGGIIVDGATEEEIKEAILDSMPIGSVSLRMDSIDPTTIYGGTWKLMTGDASLRLGGGGDLTTGVLSGNNSPVVPIPAHSHGMNHNHSTTVSSDTHDHNINLRRSGYTAAAAPSWNSDLNTVTPGTTLTQGGNYYGDSRGPIDSDTHTHTVTVNSFNGSTSVAGSANATLDVRGQYLQVNVWQRIL